MPVGGRVATARELDTFCRLGSAAVCPGFRAVDADSAAAGRVAIAREGGVAEATASRGGAASAATGSADAIHRIKLGQDGRLIANPPCHERSRSLKATALVQLLPISVEFFTTDGRLGQLPVTHLEL